MTTLRPTDVQLEQRLISPTTWKWTGQAEGNRAGPSGFLVKSISANQSTEGTLEEPEMHIGD